MTWCQTGNLFQKAGNIGDTSIQGSFVNYLVEKRRLFRKLKHVGFQPRLERKAPGGEGQTEASALGRSLPTQSTPFLPSLGPHRRKILQLQRTQRMLDFLPFHCYPKWHPWISWSQWLHHWELSIPGSTKRLRGTSRIYNNPVSGSKWLPATRKLELPLCLVIKRIANTYQVPGTGQRVFDPHNTVR